MLYRLDWKLIFFPGHVRQYNISVPSITLQFSIRDLRYDFHVQTMIDSSLLSFFFLLMIHVFLILLFVFIYLLLCQTRFSYHMVFCLFSYSITVANNGTGTAYTSGAPGFRVS